MDDVRAQYEALPYPPRDPRDEAIRLITGTPSHVLEINHYLFSGRLNFMRPFRALVAGGGTGDACIMLAQQLADRRCPGEVVYLDISTASRQICEGRAKARGLRNINFLTGSLLDLPSMPIGQFDYIDCTGVLHHLPDPAAGMRALASVLNPDGGMGVMLYGEYGRSGVYPLQELLRTLAPRSMALEDRIAMTKRLIRFLPTTNLFRRNPYLNDHVTGGDAGLYDLLLHSCDRAFTVPDIGTMARDVRPARRRLPRAGALRARDLHERSHHRAPGELAAAARARGLRRAAGRQPAHPRLLCHARGLRHGGAARGHVGHPGAARDGCAEARGRPAARHAAGRQPRRLPVARAAAGARAAHHLADRRPQDRGRDLHRARRPGRPAAVGRFLRRSSRTSTSS